MTGEVEVSRQVGVAVVLMGDEWRFGETLLKREIYFTTLDIIFLFVSP